MTKALYPIETARRIAGVFIDIIAPVCEDITIGGSIRREKSLVGDIELVIIPTYREQEVRKDLFTWETQQVCQLEVHLHRMAAEGVITPRLKSNDTLISWLGSNVQKRYVAAWFLYGHGRMPIDLFIIRPEVMDWYGWHLLLRTGPGEANKALVTPVHKGGLLPNNVYLHKGTVIHYDKPHPLRSEQEVFELWNMEYVPPRARSVETYRKALKPIWKED